RLEWNDARRDPTPHSVARAVTRRAALLGAGAGVAAAALNGTIGAVSSASAATASSIFGVSSHYNFTFVNHVTTNPFFTPTQYGAADACSLLGCSYQWTGSETSSVPQMVSAMNSAITAKRDGIAVALIDQKAFNTPTNNALKAGIPVVSYNA